VGSFTQGLNYKFFQKEKLLLIYWTFSVRTMVKLVTIAFHILPAISSTYAVPNTFIFVTLRLQEKFE
jgi:hypothetical protein